MTDSQRQRLQLEEARRLEYLTTLTNGYRSRTYGQYPKAETNAYWYYNATKYPDTENEWRIIRIIRTALSVNGLSKLDRQSRKVVSSLLGEHAF